MKLGDLILLCNTSTVMSALLSRGKAHAIGSGDLFLVLATLYCKEKSDYLFHLASCSMMFCTFCCGCCATELP